MANKNETEPYQDNSDPYVQFMNEMIDFVTLGVCFDVHRSIRLGTFDLEDIDHESQKDFEIVQQMGLDVFGQPPMKKSLECSCPNCQRGMAANRFAPHLEKCMGMGRNSSRIANRRIIATSGKMEEFEVDDDYDNDWSVECEKKGKRLKKEKPVNYSPRSRKLNPRKADNSNPYASSRMSATHNSSTVSSVAANASSSSPGNGNNNGGGSRPGTPCSNASGETSNNSKAGPTLQALESLSQEEKIALLTQTCGAISEHTGKMCTRTGRCVQHTDEQRRAARDLVLGDIDDMPLPQSMRPEGSNSLDQDDIHIDVDGYEDIDSSAPLLRDLSQISWEENSNLSIGSDIIPIPPVVTKPSRKAKSGRRSRNR